jgi:DMSO/TMAO reductase YedYZ heme-binding membrane subunit
MTEQVFRQFPTMGADPAILFARPISTVFYVLVIVITVTSFKYLKRALKKAFEDESEA